MPVSLTCQNCGKEYTVRPSRANSKYCSLSCCNESKVGVPSKLKGRSLSEETKRKMSRNSSTPRGEDHWAWRGGLTKERESAKNKREYREWRKAVLEFDNYTCCECGDRGTRLECHHIKPWSEFPDFRYDIGNGITLCKSCHIEVHRG